jgi:predicted Ser/Thr protein kinase
MTDCSGMSNPVYIITFNNDKIKDSKIVIRFFESNAADFDLEHKVFEIASKNGYAPEMIESDMKTYRVEKFEGVPLETK